MNHIILLGDSVRMHQRDMEFQQRPLFHFRQHNDLDETNQAGI